MKLTALMSALLLLFVGVELSAQENNEPMQEDSSKFVWEHAIKPEEDLLYIEEKVALYETEQASIQLEEYKAEKRAKEKEARRLSQIESERIEKERVEAERVEAERVAAKKAKEVKAKETSVEAVASEEVAKEKPVQPASSGKVSIGTFQSTAYAVGDGMTPGVITRNGTDVSRTIYSPEGYRLIAVDPNVIPLNSVVEVHVPGWTPFLAKAADTGGAIKGNIIDLLVDSPSDAHSYGRKNGIQIYIVN